MEFRPLDIKVISAEGIKNVNTFTTMDVYVEVSISNYPNQAYKQKTFVDKHSGTNPKWNHSMKFSLDEAFISNPGSYLIFRLKSERTLGDKDIGEVSIPIHDLFNQSSSKDSASAERFMEYPVITESGKPKGTLKFSYKFGEKSAAPVKKQANYEPPVTAYPGKDVHHEPVTAYPAPAHAAHAGTGYGNMGYQQNSGYGYAPPPPPPQGYGGYPPAGGTGYAYPAQQSGYGYPPVQQPGYGYPPVQQPKKKNKFGGGGLGLGLGAGLLGGLLVGDMVSDVGEMAAYEDGYGDAMGDMGDFDF